MNETLTPHKHAALIKEWAEHVASGAVDAGWYESQAKSSDGSWVSQPKNCICFADSEYRIAKTGKHPDFLPPKKKIALELELTDEQIDQMAENLRYQRFLTKAHFSLVSEVLLEALEKSL